MCSHSQNVVWNSIGCLQSHIKAIQLAKDNHLPFVLILEDDVLLADGFVAKLKSIMSELPDNWHMLYLNGSSVYRQRDYSNQLERVIRLSGAFGYVVNHTAYDRILETLSENRKPCDGYYMELQKELNCFLSKEKIVKHLDGYSVRAEKIVVFPHLR